MPSKNITILNTLNVGITKFPGDISLNYDNPPKLVMTLTQEAGGFSEKPINMQDNSACFEAWCLIIKAQTSNPGLKIELDVDGITVASYPSGKPVNGHLGRFLYRILKFSEQYKQWFELSPALEEIKKNFKNYLDTNKFETNAPLNEAETDLDKLLNKGLERYDEQLLVDTGSYKTKILKLSSASAIVGRQLPVGLFVGTKAKEHVVFTGGTSAADFWAVDGDTVKVYELKSKNPMVGIITEIFFYSNYVCDVFIEKGNKMNPNKPKKYYRNYDKIKGKKVQGIMLSNSDGWHASLKDVASRNQIIDIMNDNSIEKKIQYAWIEYNFKMSITVTP
jgi:RNA-metabolizing metallo-beta-lactamase